MYSKLTNKSIPILNKSNPRYSKVEKITPHYMAGDMAASNCAAYHRDSDRQASANYYIGSDGTIVSGVPEERRAWTSSSEWNDQRAQTIECANIRNDTGELTPACYRSLVRLCADLCTRYSIDPHYDGTVNGTITYHSMYAATSCPGPWLTQKIVSGQFERDIKARMKPADPKPDPKPAAKPKPKIEDKARAVHRLYNPNSGDHLYTTSYAEAKAQQNAGMEYEGIAWIYPETGDGIYRLVSGGQHHLALKDEHDKLVKLGWKSEGMIARSGGEGRPIRRLYNPNSGGEHIFTTSDKEHNALAAAGWKCELAPFTY